MKGLTSLLALLITALLVALLYTTYGTHWRIPDRHNPFAPLSIDDAPNWLTRYKLDRLGRVPAECSAVLAQADMKYEVVPDRETGPQCGFSNAVRITQTSMQIGSPFVLSCRAAVSLALWERHTVQPEAQRVFGSSVRRMDHFGSYSCRNVYGKAVGARSQHATADALDVSGFVLQNGQRILVLSNWNDADARGEFLRSIHSGACKYFDSVFGPEYNAEHANHFHLDRGRYRSCR